jgi:acetaldehyde dehydrogenase/alcohol dehydrogenase
MCVRCSPSGSTSRGFDQVEEARNPWGTQDAPGSAGADHARMTSTTETQAIGEVDGEQALRLDGFVERAQAAARALRRLDREAVDRIVWAMVVAGLESAVELAELAMEETGFGVFEDKVVKNYIATEFLFDYLKDKRTAGVIDEDPRRQIEYLA